MHREKEYAVEKEWHEEEFRDMMENNLDLSFDCMTNKNDCTFIRNTKRKTQKLLNLLTKYYESYSGKWDPAIFNDLIEQSGFNKKQLNKWFWDRKKKERDSLQAKKLSYPGLIFSITNTKSGKDLTPTFSAIASRLPLFKTTKVRKTDL